MKKLLYIFALVLLNIKLVLACSSSQYSAQAVQAAQSAGNKVIIHFVKEGCSTCAAQEAVLKNLDPSPCQNVKIFSAEIRKEMRLAGLYNIWRQAVFVAINNQGQQTSRLEFQTDEKSIQDFIETVKAGN